MVISKTVTPGTTTNAVTQPIELPPSTVGMTTKVVKGSLWTLAGQVTPLAVSLITTPFIIRMLGAESYGVLILILLIPTYVGFADFGMGLASTRFASEAYAEGDSEKEAGVVRTAAVIALCSSLPIAAAMVAFSLQIVSLFKVPEQLQPQASLALKFAAVTFVVNLLNGIFNTPQLTRLRMDLNTLVNAGFRILGLIATPFAIFYAGVVGAVFVLMLASILTLLGHLFFSGSLTRHLFELSLDRSVVGRLLKFGGAFVGASIAAVLLVNVEKGILAATVSTEALAHYSVAFTLASMLTMFSASMTQSLMPAFSQLQSFEKREQLNSLYSRGIRLSLVWIIPSIALLAVVARPFFAVWAGAEFARQSSPSFYVLLFGVACNIVAFLPNTAIMSAGRTDALAKLYWIELLFYAALVWFLASRFGALGAAIAWSARVFVDAVLQFVIAKRLAGTSYVKRTNLSFVLAAFIMILPFAASLYYEALNPDVVIGLVACLIAYAVLTWKAILEKEEIEWLIARFNARFARPRFDR